MRHKVLLLVGMLMITVCMLGQVQTGTVSGTVRDSTGAVVPNATVTATNLGTGATRTVQTNSSGGYTIVALPPANYEIAVTSGSFAPFKQQVQVTVGGYSTVDATLGITGASTTVEVLAAAGGVEVNTQTQELSTIVTPTQIANLPSLTRNPYDFVALTGNVSNGDNGMTTENPQFQAGNPTENGAARGVGYSINGQRPTGTEILLDGAENINLFDTSMALIIPQDAVQEFRVVTNNFDAQYGRASGGVINLTTKSGTNTWHGSAWEFNRLSAYTANTFDNVANDVPKGHYTRNQFGYALGGPIKKDKLFIFASTEWARVRSSGTVIAYVPTPQLLAATPPNVQQYFNLFGQNQSPIISTLSKEDLAGKFTPGGAFDTAIPAGTPVFGQVHYKAPIDNGGDIPQNTYDLVARTDYNLSDKTQMFLRYGRENFLQFPGTQFNSPYPQYNVGGQNVDDNFLFSVTHTFSPTVFSNTKLSFNRDFTAFTFDNTLQNTPTLFLFNGATVNGQPIDLPGFYDRFTGTGGLPYGGPQNAFQLNQDLAWIKGSHTMRYGGQYNYSQINRAFGAYAQAVQQLGTSLAKGLDNMIDGTLTKFQVAVNPKGAFPCDRDYVTGLLVQPSNGQNCTINLPTGPPPFSRSYRYNDWALYAEDSWRTTPRLTLNYGLRYEHYGVQHNSDPNLDSNFYYGPGSNLLEQIRNGSVQLAKNSGVGGLWKPRWGTVAPRVGFAYDLFGNGSTSLRGGYGMSYERNFGNVTFNMIQNVPAYATPQLTNIPVQTTDFGPVSGGSGSVLLPPTSPRHVAQNINVAQTQFWSLSLERQLGHSSVFGLDYNGAHGIHLYDISNSNREGAGNVYLGDPAPFKSFLNPQFTSINTRGSNGYSHYNGLTARFQSNNFGNTGLSIQSNYTWSHALDNLSSTFGENSTGSNGVGNLGYLDPTHPSLDYGSADYDVRHRAVVSLIWQEPFYKGEKGIKRQVLGGYTLTPIFTVRSGIPFSVMDSTNSLNAGFASGIPRYTPTGSISSFSATSTTGVLGPNDFSVLTMPAANSFSDPINGVSDFGICTNGVAPCVYPSNMTRRNAFRGPGAWTFDMALSKSIKVTERVGMEFRAEGFNLLNHHNLYINGYDADAALVGSSSGVVLDAKKGGLAALTGFPTDERRFGQFAVKILF